jgi:hypothetical protein
LELLDHVTIPMTEKDAPKLTGIADAMWTQEKFMRSLRPVVGCGGFYHLIFPDVPSIRPLLEPILETLVGIETELEEISARGGHQPSNWVNDQLAKLPKDSRDFVVKFQAAIPQARQTEGSDDDSPRWADCDPAKLDLQPPVPTMGMTVQPPYLSMFLANAYAALEEKDAGLRILNRWIKYYEYIGKMYPRWLHDRAVWEYGVVQEADLTLPSTSAERRYLEIMQRQFSDDWNISLNSDGYKCDDAAAKADVAADQKEQIRDYHATEFSAGAKARLILLYSSVLQRLLYVTVQTLPTLEHDYLTVDQEDWARELITAADRCLLDEEDGWREYRQALNRISGGITLARWAEDGPRSGLVHPSTVPDVQKEAIGVLLDALPVIQSREAKDEAKVDGLHTDVTQWEVFRHLAQRTILDLQAKLTR